MFRPAPSSWNSTETSLPSWRTWMAIEPAASLPAAARTSGVSTPCATQLRSRCSKAGVMRSSTPRSISIEPPRMSSFTCLALSLAASRTTRYRRSEMPSNSTMRVRSRSRCSSRVCRPWAIRSSSVASTTRWMLRCTVATSFTDSAIRRVSSCTRVKRSNSSGSKPPPCPWPAPCATASATGLHLDLAQLRTQAVQVAREVAQGAAQLAQFGFEPGTGDHHLAGLADQPVQQAASVRGPPGWPTGARS